MSKKFQLIKILLMVLVLIASLFVVFFYFPFIQGNSFGSVPITVLLLIANVVCFILVRKGVLPKPSLIERKVGLVLVVSNVTAVFVIGLLLGVFKAATHQNLFLVTLVMTVVLTIGLLLAAFRARTSEKLHIARA